MYSNDFQSISFKFYLFFVVYSYSTKVINIVQIYTGLTYPIKNSI